MDTNTKSDPTSKTPNPSIQIPDPPIELTNPAPSIQIPDPPIEPIKPSPSITIPDRPADLANPIPYSEPIVPEGNHATTTNTPVANMPGPAPTVVLSNNTTSNFQPPEMTPKPEDYIPKQIDPTSVITAKTTFSTNKYTTPIPANIKKEPISPKPPNPLNNTFSPHHKFPMMIVTMVIITIILGFGGSFLYFSAKENAINLFNAPQTSKNEKPKSIVANPTKSTANTPTISDVIASPTIAQKNNTSSLSAEYINPFETYENPFDEETNPSVAGTNDYINPFE